MAIIRPVGKVGIVIWRGNVWAGDTSWHKFRITEAEYLALGQQGAGAPRTDPTFPGSSALWATLWSLGQGYMSARLRDLFDTPSGDPSPGDIVIGGRRIDSDIDTIGGFTQLSVADAIAAAKTDTR